jgi:hypothetical protein
MLLTLSQYMPRQRPPYPNPLYVEILEKVLAEAKPLAYSHGAITGGEPPLHPYFGEALKMIARRGLTYHFFNQCKRFSKNH